MEIKFHTGAEIRKRLNEQKRSVLWLVEETGCDNSSLGRRLNNLKHLILTGVILCFICNACSHSAKNVEDDYIHQIDVMANLANTRTIYLSEIASNIEYSVLETDKKCLVSPNMFIHCSKEHIVAIGSQTVNNDVCYVFERTTGNFLRQISRLGRGPGEYQSVKADFWDCNKEQICLLGNHQYLFYNLDGTLSHQTNMFKRRIEHFLAFEDFYVGYATNHLGDNTVRIAFYDMTGAMIDSIPNHRTWERTRQEIVRMGYDSWLYTFKDNLYFKELYCATLYQINDFMLKPRYVFNTNGRTVPYEAQEKGRWDFMASLTNGGVSVDLYENYVNILKIFEDNNFLYFTIEYRNQLYPAYYDKVAEKLQTMTSISIPPRTGRGWKIPLYGFQNDLDGGLPFWPQQMISDKEMMCVYTAEELLVLDTSIIIDEKLKKVLNNLNEESNPVVAIVTLK